MSQISDYWISFRIFFFKFFDFSFCYLFIYLRFVALELFAGQFLGAGWSLAECTAASSVAVIGYWQFGII